MSIWDSYQNRISSHGATKHEALKKRELRFLNSRLSDGLAYHTVELYPQEYGYNINSPESAAYRITQDVSIIDSDNYNEKTIISLPGEDISLGSLVVWMGGYYLVTERDANTTLYTRAKLLQCNHLLKWVADDHRIIEQWSIFDDATKYMTGFLEDKDFFTRRGDARTSVQLARNKYSILLDRDNRFLIDDPDKPLKMAYQLTKPVKGTLLYGNKGTYSFALQEVVSTEYDNHELGIADYYRHFPKPADAIPKKDETHKTENNGKKVWI